MVLPGQIFAYYNWGGTLDAILPRLTGKPVAVRYETPYSDLHAVDLLTTIDDLVQQNRLVPGELSPLLRLMGARRRDHRHRRRHLAQRRARPRRGRPGARRPGARPPRRRATGRCTHAPRRRGRHRSRGLTAPGAPLRHSRAGAGSSTSTPWPTPTVVDGSAAGSLAAMAAFGGAAVQGRDPLRRRPDRRRRCARRRRAARTSWSATPTAAGVPPRVHAAEPRAPRCPRARRSRPTPR